MFSIGDLVVHPMHGAGVIDDIVQEKVAGVMKEYYVFKMPVGGLVLKIPTANSQVIGIRGIISQAEAEELLNALPAPDGGGQCQLEQAISGKFNAVEEWGFISGRPGH